MKIKIDLKWNSDGTITAFAKNDRYTFTNEPWYTDEDRLEQAVWGFRLLGVNVDAGTMRRPDGKKLRNKGD